MTPKPPLVYPLAEAELELRRHRKELGRQRATLGRMEARLDVLESTLRTLRAEQETIEFVPTRANERWVELEPMIPPGELVEIQLPAGGVTQAIWDNGWLTSWRTPFPFPERILRWRPL